MSHCRAEVNPMFVPAARLVLSVTRGATTLVTSSLDGTTAGDHGYKTGLIVRFHIPPNIGMSELDRQYAQITVVNSTQFTIPIDTSNYDPFEIPVGISDFVDTCAWIVPIGEGTDYMDSISTNVSY